MYNEAHIQLVAQAKAIHLCHKMCPNAKIGPAPNITTSYLFIGEDGHVFDPYCIRVTARRLTDRYHLPVIITENGYGRPDTLEEDGSIHDSYRIEHLRETIRQMEIGIKEGADIIGYCSWSAVDLVSTREGITKRY